MRVGILGSGLMGGKLGTIWARAGHEVVFSYARSEQKLKRLARAANGSATAGTPSDAAKGADALLLAVHWSRVDDVLKQAGDLSGKVIVSCSLPMNLDNTGLIIGRTTSGSEELAKKHPGAEVVADACSDAGRDAPETAKRLRASRSARVARARVSLIRTGSWPRAA